MNAFNYVRTSRGARRPGSGDQRWLDQLQDFGFERAVAEMTMHIVCAALGDVDRSTIREGEFLCHTLGGWNFGDGHLHDERLVAAVQPRLGFAPGELREMDVESCPTRSASGPGCPTARSR